MRRYGVLVVLIALCLLLPSGSSAVGTLSIPNIIANQPAGNLQASLLDSNWNAIRDYVNNREITSGTLSGRPVASIAGRWYFATDVLGGTLYFDNGSAWTAVAPGVQVAGGTYSVRGLVGATVSATNTQYNLSANRVVLLSPSDGTTIARTATTTLTNNILTSGPAANGRDSTTAFSASSWIYLYFIWNGTSLDTLSSACAPSDANGSCSPSFGPTLPTGYTHWAYAGALRVGSTGLIANMRMSGARGCYYAAQALVSANTAIVETTVSVASQVAPNATRFQVRGSANNTSGGALSVTFRYVSAQDFFVDTVSATTNATIELELPNVGQQLFFQWNGAPGGGTTIQTMCFTNPNGDS